MVRHALRVFGFSLFATITLFPVSAVDAYYITTFNSYFWFLTFLIILISDLISAFFTHFSAEHLVKLVVRSEKKKRKLEEVGRKLADKGKWGMVLFAATPLPYSLAIYTYAGAQTPFKQIVVPLLIGRIIKYSIITGAIFFGWGVFWL